MVSDAGSGVPAPPADESRLIERIREGDAAAFGELVRRYQRRAFAVAWRLLGQREDAEDLVQDSFIAALDQLDTFDRMRPFGPWFFRLLVNRGHNARKARTVRSADHLGDELLASGQSPARELEQKEVGERVALALGELSERQRLVVQLYELDGFSTADVAGMLDIAEPTVRWTLHAARKRLREELRNWKEERDNES